MPPRDLLVTVLVLFALVYAAWLLRRSLPRGDSETARAALVGALRALPRQRRVRQSLVAALVLIVLVLALVWLGIIGGRASG